MPLAWGPEMLEAEVTSAVVSAQGVRRGCLERTGGGGYLRGQSETVITSVLGPELPGTLSCTHLRERLFVSVWCLCLSLTVSFPHGSFVVPVRSSPVPGMSVKRRNDQVKSLFVASLPVFIDGVKVVVSVFLTTERVSHKGSYWSGPSFVRPQLASATEFWSHRLL